jgi:hypothetical protein
MNKVVNEDEILNKLKGKYSSLYPVYEKLRDELFGFGTNICIRLFTIYFSIYFDNDLFAVVYWRDGYFEIGLPTKKEHERLSSGKHLKWKQIFTVLKIHNKDEIDDFVIDLFKEINTANTNTRNIDSH